MASGNSNAIADAIASSNTFRMPTGNRGTSRLSTWNPHAEGENTARRVAEAALRMPPARFNPAARPFVPRMNPNAAPWRPAAAGAASRRRRRNNRRTRRANRR